MMDPSTSAKISVCMIRCRNFVFLVGTGPIVLTTEMAILMDVRAFYFTSLINKNVVSIPARSLDINVLFGSILQTYTETGAESR